MNLKKQFGVVFDFDGTLIDSVPMAYRGVCNIFNKSGLISPTFYEFCTKFSAPYMDFYRERGVTASESQTWDWYHEAARHEETVFFADVEDTLRTLSSFQIPMSIVSAQRQEILDKHCSASIAKHLRAVVGDAQHKVEHIRAQAINFGLPFNRVLYVGDFISDVRDAISAEVIPVGITRNQPTRECLMEAGAHHCIDNLAGLFEVLEKIN